MSRLSSTFTVWEHGFRVSNRSSLSSAISGKKEALLTQLQHCLGVGGTVKDGQVELQGELKSKVENWLM
jgi:hypothetical protein